MAFQHGGERDGMLFVHRAERTDSLAEALSAQLRTPLDNPFAAEIVGMPSKGIERWLAQRFSHRLGVSGAEDGGLRERPLPLHDRSDGTRRRAEPWRRSLEPGPACMSAPGGQAAVRAVGAEGMDDQAPAGEKPEVPELWTQRQERYPSRAGGNPAAAPTRKEMVLVGWAGIRGILALAAAGAIPNTPRRARRSPAATPSKPSPC
jgi:hypothetical protein